jgi:hypothetical protein
MHPRKFASCRSPIRGIHPGQARVLPAHRHVPDHAHRCDPERYAGSEPRLAQAVYQGFCEAKDTALKEYEHGHIFNNMATMFPWFSHLLEENKALLGSDWRHYGIGANRTALESLLRYQREQGITDRLFKIEDIFVPELLNT